ncbi:hypothetical protein Tco_1287057 [Tanacetum coccineum]
MVEKSKLDEDKEGKAVDPSRYRDMIGTLLYLTSIKRIFRYLRGTVNQGLWYLKDSLIALTAFADADHDGCQDTRPEYIAMSGCYAQILWMRSQLTDYSLGFNKIPIHQISLIKEHVENGVIELYFVNTEYQLADSFTKALAKERIEFLISKLGMQSFTPETLKHLADEVDE